MCGRGIVFVWLIPMMIFAILWWAIFVVTTTLLGIDIAPFEVGGYLSMLAVVLGVVSGIVWKVIRHRRQ